jgi:hypothetical protein
MLFVLLDCNAVSYQTKQAWTQYEAVISEIENSHFEKEVINEMIQVSRSKGYEVNVVKDDIYNERTRYFVSLTYKVKIPILEFETKREINGYAI